MSRGRKGEVKHDGLSLQVGVLHNGVGDLLQLGRVMADEDQVEAPTCELQRHGPYSVDLFSD